MAAEAVRLLFPVGHILQNDNESNGEEVQGTDNPTKEKLWREERGRGGERGEGRGGGKRRGKGRSRRERRERRGEGEETYKLIN